MHGGGKEIDAALKVAGIEKRQVDGLRITDEATLDVVVSVLAGAVNTRFVAALNTAGVAAVGLTGADAACGLSAAAPPHQAVDGRIVDLGRVGVPEAGADMRLLQTLTAERFVPVIACIGLGRDGRLFNVNADTFAGHLAARLGARRLVIAGTTPGVLDAAGDDAADAAAPTLSRGWWRRHGNGRDDRQAARLRTRAGGGRGRCRDRGRTQGGDADRRGARARRRRRRRGWSANAGAAR